MWRGKRGRKKRRWGGDRVRRCKGEKEGRRRRRQKQRRKGERKRQNKKRCRINFTMRLKTNKKTTTIKK